jgi:hypothetical protein
MMGQLPAGQSALFYDFCLNDYIPQDHFLRKIDHILDLSELRRYLAPFYSHTGRPWFSPDFLDTSKRVDNMNLQRGDYEEKKIHTGIQRRSCLVG